MNRELSGKAPFLPILQTQSKYGIIPTKMQGGLVGLCCATVVALANGWLGEKLGVNT